MRKQTIRAWLELICQRLDRIDLRLEAQDRKLDCIASAVQELLESRKVVGIKVEPGTPTPRQPDLPKP